MSTGNSITLEVCIDSVESAICAVKGGANRLEICANLGVGGGTTPSLGLVKSVEKELEGKSNIDLMVMIRPRIGDFVYSAAEVLVMNLDIKEFAKFRRVKGVVFGALTSEGAVDVEVTKHLVSLAHESGLQVCFHRAFDMVENQRKALQELCLIPGITRILTSGGTPQAPNALPALQDLCRLTPPFTIMPGSGLNASTLPPVIRALVPLGVREVHLSGGAWQPGGTQFRPEEDMGMGAGGNHEWSVWRTSEEKVRAARGVCDAFMQGWEGEDSESICN